MDNISLEGLLRQYITNSQNQMFTAMPARVERVVSLPEQRVDVQLLVDRVRPEGGTLRHPVILSVPLVFPGSKTSQFSFPVAAGDVVLCVFSQRSIDRFKLGSENNHIPTDLRKYSRNDAMAIPGLYSFPQARNNPSHRSLSHDVSDTVISHNIGSGNECEVRLKASGDVIINSPGKVEVNCQESVINASISTTIDSPQTTVTGNMLVEGVLTYVSGMVGSGGTGSAATITGSVSVTDDVTAGNISLRNHVHPENDNGGPTGPPQ
jgi:phage baseplate assembly protein gpV